jgi:uncharacterized protein (DUF1800 family)
LDAATARGPAEELRRLIAAVPADSRPDPWDDAKLPLDPRDQPSRLYAIQAWLDALVASTQPLVDRMAWLWHGHFVSGIDKVRVGRLMADQIRLFRSQGLGPFPTLLRAVTIDPAMLVYLDLRTSTGSAPNENYAREVLELFALGAAHFTEADVKAGARALTGWTLVGGDAQFVSRRHDNTPVRYLETDGVHDLDTVVAAIVARPELAELVAGVVAFELLGTAPDDLVSRLAASFRSSGLDLRSLVGATLQAGIDGTTEPIVLGPVLWLVQAQRVTGAKVDDGRRLALLRAAGQLPMLPPNVAGWPGGAAWFAAGTVVARTNLAAVVAAGTPADAAVMAASRGTDLAALAAALGLPEPFGDATAAVLGAARPGAPRLALALSSPDFVIA